MGLFSIFRKNKQEPDSDEGAFLSRAEEESNTIRGRGKRQRGDKPADPVLPEKKRARRRLVGAVALVLAMIIGLPMILDSEPKPLADDIAIQIPSKDKPAQPATPGPSAPSVPASVSAQQEQPAAPVPASASASASASAAVPPASAPKEGDKPAPAPAQNAASASAEAHPAATADASVKPAANADETARALAILEGRPDPAPAKAEAKPKPDKFVIQVAALATQDKVDQLRGKLTAAGVKSYTQKVATEKGPRIRVRVGPFGSKDEAEKARAKLAKLGMKSTLVSGATH